MDQTAVPITASWLRRRMEAFNAMSAIEKTYAVGICLCAAGILIPAVKEVQAISGPCLLVGGIFLVAALARESYVIVLAHWQAPWAKWLMVPVAVMAGAYSLGSSANIINAVTGQDPAYFPRATAFMAPIAAIPALAFLVCILAGLALLIMFFVWLNQVSSKRQSRGGGAWLWPGRITAALATMALIWPAIAAESGFGKGVENVAGWVAYGLDMHTDPSCSVEDRSRVSRVNDELVLVVTLEPDAGLVFQRVMCPLEAE